MCNNYASHVPAQAVAEAAAAMDLSVSLESGNVPNLEPSDDIRIGDRAPLLIASEGGATLVVRPWAWKSPQGRPVFNFRSDGRRFSGAARCLIPADAFYEFTAAEPGQARKTKWRFCLTDEPWFWIAGLVRDRAFAMLTTEPGPDIAPFHDRQVVVLPRLAGADWLQLRRDEAELLRPAPAGSLTVEKVWPPAA